VINLLVLQDTDTFCREILCNPEVTAFLSASLLCWATTISSAKGYELSGILQVSTYPFLAVLHPGSSHAAPFHLTATVAGACTAAQLLNAVGAALQTSQRRVVASRSAQESLAAERQVRQAQDVALAASMEADRARMAQRDAAVAAAEAKHAEQERSAEKQRYGPAAWA
jgi:FAS-associated factor 2